VSGKLERSARDLATKAARLEVPKAVADVFGPYRDDPVGFVREVLGAESATRRSDGEPYQFRLLEDVVTARASRCRRGTGSAARRIGNFRGVRLTACKSAGVEGRLVHDLRRTAARDLRRAGVSEGEIMKLCGWKTRAMFDRYCMISEQDLARAVAKRFTNGQGTAKWEGTAVPVGPLS
jgi:integrase